MITFDRSKRQELAEAKELYRSLHKNRVYSEDLLSPADLKKVKDLEDRYTVAIHQKDFATFPKLKADTNKIGDRLFPASATDSWRENVEVLVVALVVALAIRSFFLQPFKIPTGSMEPTLNGVQLTRIETPIPSFPIRIVEFFIRGESYGSIKTELGGTLTEMRSGQFTPWFEYTDLVIGEKTVRVWVSRYALQVKLGFREGMVFPPGPIVSFRVNTGDQVLVNKMSYNFRQPQRGEVFVFKTTGIKEIEEPRRQQGLEGSQYYIKRCVGVPNDVLTLDPPLLRVNGEVAHSEAFDRVYSKKNGYAGYVIKPEAQFLTSMTDPVTIATGTYWAMGDNSPNSFDSRYWGPVEKSNLVGTGWFVYWPFTSHWGFIR